MIIEYPVIEVISLTVVIGVVVVSKLQMRDFGLNLTGWKRSILESLIVSEGFILLLMLIKYLCIKHHPGLIPETNLFDLSYFGFATSPNWWWLPCRNFSVGVWCRIPSKKFWISVTADSFPYW